MTGFNASGKTTYLKTVATLSLLAHIGCYVPARFASFRKLTRIMSRFDAGDVGVEENASSFYAEMRDCSYILQNASENSLVLMDEVGRGTSNMDGVGRKYPSQCNSNKQTNS